MKTKALALLALTCLSTLTPQLSTVFAQGSLTPPGAPAPTMKTLTQIEPRAPISSAPFTISASGSYYLTTNLTVSTGDAITIATNGVTLDLNGFTLFSTAASATGYGILLTSGRSDITIFNGHIKGGVTNNAGTYNGPGFQRGISYSGDVPLNTRIAGVSVSGCLNDGIYLGYLNYDDSTVVESCVVRTVGGRGIRASTIKSSVAVGCGIYAIGGVVVSDCRGESTGSGEGVYAYHSAQNSYGFSSNGIGLHVDTALNCCGYSSNSYGLYAYSAQNCDGLSGTGTGLAAVLTAQNCRGYSGGSGTGLDTYAAQNCYGSCAGSGTGLSSVTALNCIGSSAGSGTGLFASDSAQNCSGSSGGSGYGLRTYNIAIGCRGSSSSGTGLSATLANSCLGSGSPAVSATYKYNMP